MENYHNFDKKGSTPAIPGTTVWKIAMRISLLYIFMLSWGLQLSTARPADGQDLSRIQVIAGMDGESLPELFRSIEEQTDLRFVFLNHQVAPFQDIDFAAAKRSVKEVLDLALAHTPLQYTLIHKNILIYRIEPDAGSGKSPEHLVQQLRKQLGTVTGRVTDAESGDGLPGANVIFEGTNRGSATNIEGYYTIEDISPGEYTLTASFLGYESQSVTVTIAEDVADTVNFSLQRAAGELGELEVISTGYSDIQRERVTGSIAQVSRETIERKIGQSVSEILEGQVPGLVNYNGDVLIRGVNNFRNDSRPLYVVDGLPFEGNLSEIAPETVESMNVLKDAAAAAIYGARAANGVVVINTKRGIAGRTSVSVSMDVSTTPKPDIGYLNYASSADLVDYTLQLYAQDESFNNDPVQWLSIREENNTGLDRVGHILIREKLGMISSSEAENLLQRARETDYLRQYSDHIWQNTTNRRLHFSLSTGNERSNTYVSATYNHRDERTINHFNDRFTAYLKNTQYVNENLMIDYGLDASLDRRQSVNIEGRASNAGAIPGGLFRSSSGQPRLSRFETMFDEEGNPVSMDMIANPYTGANMASLGLPDMRYNLLEEMHNNLSNLDGESIRGFANITYDLTPWLQFNPSLQYQRITSKNVSIYDQDAYTMQLLLNQFTQINSEGNPEHGLPPGDQKITQNFQSHNYTLRGQLNADFEIADRHSLDFILGTEIREILAQSEYNRVFGYDRVTQQYQRVDQNLLADGMVGVLSQFPVTYTAPFYEQSESRDRFFSLYTTGQYSLDDTYNLSGSIRVDQSNLFGTDPKYQFRPMWSLGGNWFLSREDFFHVPWVDELRFRASYGVNGNVDRTTSPYLIGHVGLSTMHNIQRWVGIVSPPNPLLRWERNAITNLGVDFTLLGQRLHGSVDYYYKKGTDLLAQKSLDPTIGFSIATFNNGSMTNRGIEVSLTPAWIRRQSLNWSSTFNVAYNHNRVEKIEYEPSGASDLISSGYHVPDKPVRSMWSYRYAGLDERGYPTVYDPDGNPASSYINDPEIATYSGSLIPLVSGSVNNIIQYKGIELSMLFIFHAGHKLRTDVPVLQRWPGNNLKSFVNHWREPGDEAFTDVPRMGSLETVQQFWDKADTHVQSASYIKLRNLILSYHLPDHLFPGARNIRLRVQIDNVWWYAVNDAGIDPEAYQANAGVRNLQIPPTYSFGINVNL